MLVAVLALPAAAGYSQPYPTPDYRIAFLADQGASGASVAVLELIRAERAGDDPEGWDARITRTLGADMPYLVAIGNHDLGAWDGYAAVLQRRLSRTPEVRCEGRLGVKARCTVNGVLVVLSGVGTMGVGHAGFIHRALDGAEQRWRFCAWHKNQRLMQTGGKRNAVGWQVYDECRRGGAIIATGHEHSYARTHLMLDFARQRYVPARDQVTVRPGATFAFVSGLGGRSVRWPAASLAANPWWASIYTAAQAAAPGALFCTLHVDGEPRRARCYFKDITGRVADRFEVQLADQ